MNVTILKEKLDALADAIGIKSKKRVPATIDDLTEIVETSFELQEKTVAPATEAQSVEADEGYYGISRVDIDKMKLEHASATLTANGQAFTPSEGYDGMSEIYVFPRSLTGTAYIDAGYATVSGQFRWRARGRYYVSAAGWRSTGNYYGSYTNYAAIPTGTTVTPTESAQTIGGTNTMMQGAVTVNPIPSEYIVPTGTKSITQNGTGIDVASFASVDVNVSGGGQPTLQTKSVSYTPTETAQSATVTADNGYDGLDEVSVSVGAISNTYVGTGITRRSSTDLTASGATVTVPSGYYSAQATKSVASGTAGTPTAVTNWSGDHTVTITPSVTNTTGYITGGTKNGTAVTVSASDLVDDHVYLIGDNGTYDLTNYGTVSVDVGTNYQGISRYYTPSTTVQYDIITADSSHDALEYADITIAPMPSGTEGTPTATKGAVSNHSVSVTPSVTNTSGYITGSTKTGTAVTVSASELVSGDLAITQNGNSIDCANYSTVSVNVPSGGGVNIGTATATTYDTTSTSLQFTELLGEPKAFFARCIASMTRSTSGRYYYCATMCYDGTNTYGNRYYRYSGQFSNITSGYSFTYSNGTLTLSSSGNQTTSPGSFWAGVYELVYIY